MAAPREGVVCPRHIPVGEDHPGRNGCASGQRAPGHPGGAHPVSRLDILDVITDRDDRAYRLVPEHHRLGPVRPVDTVQARRQAVGGDLDGLAAQLLTPAGKEMNCHSHHGRPAVPSLAQGQLAALQRGLLALEAGAVKPACRHGLGKNRFRQCQRPFDVRWNRVVYPGNAGNWRAPGRSIGQERFVQDHPEDYPGRTKQHQQQTRPGHCLEHRRPGPASRFLAQPGGGGTRARRLRRR